MDMLATGALVAAALIVSALAPGHAAQTATTYRRVSVDGVSVFYREAGPKEAPTLLLLHGFPSSSRMWEPLMSRLADRYRLVAPDYPGFGHSDAPDPKNFAYTFDHIAEAIDHFTQTLGLKRWVLVMQDYGGPVGFRLALAHPERVSALVVQNAVAHEDGLGPLWDARRRFWADRAANEDRLRANLISPEATRQRHVGSSPNLDLYDPDLWTDETAFLNRPGMVQIQSDLFYDYRTNVAFYPRWQAWLREHQPPTLVVWGRYVRRRRGGGLCARRQGRRSACHRRWSFRHGRGTGPGGGVCPRLSFQAKPRHAAWRSTVTIDRAS